MQISYLTLLNLTLLNQAFYVTLVVLLYRVISF